MEGWAGLRRRTDEAGQSLIREGSGLCEAMQVERVSDEDKGPGAEDQVEDAAGWAAKRLAGLMACVFVPNADIANLITEGKHA